MKTSMKLFALGIALLGFGMNVNAQVTTVSANAPTEATIITPLAIENTVSLVFGNAAATSSAGTLILGTNGSRTATGGVMLSPSNTGTPTAAEFAITGEGNYGFTITLPSSALTLTDENSHTMTVDTFVSSLGASSSLTSGSATLNVGATLHIGANQSNGHYTNTTGFQVTVNYN